jgi:putative nucleotidyltransferase with HDIG domain
MAANGRISLFIGITVLAAFLMSAAILVLFQPAAGGAWSLALALFILLSVLASHLSFRVTTTGSVASLEFLPELGCLILLGPAGALVESVVSGLVTQHFIFRNPPRKVAFNVAQSVLSIGVAGFVYTGLGGSPSLSTLTFSQAFPPFVAAAVTYFATNSVAVSSIMTLSAEGSFADIWLRLYGKTVLFDVIISPFAYAVAYLYVRWGVLALILAVVPIIGLRYSYGVNIQLQQLNRDLLRVLVKTLEAQDPYTSGHSIRVAERAKLVAEQLGLRAGHVRIIETAALLHDIGKIGNEFSRILRQKGPLTPEQRELIRSHPERGVEIIQSVRALDPLVLACVRHHHERFDGTGYPAGLTGEEIPLGARIIMVSDTIDAMLTARPYRDALPVAVVHAELLKCTGSQFDPRIVRAFLATGLFGETVDDEPSVPEIPNFDDGQARRTASL